jgi:hypothetical protein
MWYEESGYCSHSCEIDEGVAGRLSETVSMSGVLDFVRGFNGAFIDWLRA